MNEIVETKPANILEQIEERSEEFAAGLPAHMPVERFKRVLMTAVQNSPTLAKADRRTFFTSAMKCAQDGLLPDGREAALVIYKTKKKEGNREFWIDAVQYIPMVGGIRKKVRNSGEIATWDVKAVFQKDEFLYEEGLDVILKHKPFIDGDAGPLRAVYSVCKMKSGEVSIDVMPVHQVERIRLMSKSADRGPWKDHFVEMAKKTVARRHSKVLPMSSDLDDLMRRDDVLYDMKGAADDKQLPAVNRPKLSDFTAAPVDEIDAETGEVTDGMGHPLDGGAPEAVEAPAAAEATPAPAESAKPASKASAPPAHPSEAQGEAEEVSALEVAEKRGRQARAKGIAYRAIPPEYREPGKADLAKAWQDAWREEDRAHKPAEDQAG